MSSPRFVLDAMLGRLGHWLRAMGYDTVYLGAAEDDRLLAVSRDEGRVLVTRDGALARRAGRQGCLLHADRLAEQLLEIVTALALPVDDAQWLSRCLECNAVLETRTPDAVRDRVPPRILAAHAEFWGCPDCGKVYWAGSHADRILERLRRVRTGFLDD